MKLSLRKGFSFGLTSGIITTLGLIIGLNAGTHSRLVVIGGILTIAVADALSDASGMHISEEAEAKHTDKSIWESTFATLSSKFVFALTFMIPVLLFKELNNAVIASIIWGLFLIALVSYYIAKKEKAKPFKVITEHLTLTVLVIILTHLVGIFVAAYF
ncbi:hypothetical protein KY343_05950 [Candidatus Woesearchaeota archaeon]|nr:hypothetical protein [Candidatus Woesearchaeota archaeon]